MTRIAAHSDSDTSPTQVGRIYNEEDGDETEYEIEEVLDAKRGIFPDGRMAYFVKWKGYGPSDNSWVVEQDAQNAKDLVDEYWRKNPIKKSGRKSMDKKQTPAKGRKSIPVDDSSDVVETRPKKRGRNPTSKSAKSDSEMEVDDPQPSKKPRKSQTKKPQKATSNEIVGNMSKWMHLEDWEPLVATVDTVERESDDSLTVYFTLNSGDFVMASSAMCNKRFPQTLLRFYESNLKWRTVEEM